MLNKLHVNLEKSCFMYFNKTTSSATDNDHEINPPIIIGSTEITLCIRIFCTTNSKVTTDELTCVMCAYYVVEILLNAQQSGNGVHNMCLYTISPHISNKASKCEQK